MLHLLEVSIWTISFSYIRHRVSQNLHPTAAKLSWALYPELLACEASIMSYLSLEDLMATSTYMNGGKVIALQHMPLNSHPKSYGCCSRSGTVHRYPAAKYIPIQSEDTIDLCFKPSSMINDIFGTYRNDSDIADHCHDSNFATRILLCSVFVSTSTSPLIVMRMQVYGQDPSTNGQLFEILAGFWNGHLQYSL